MNLEHIIEAQAGLIDALGKFAAGELEPAAFKPFGAPFGVYQQRNGDFMNRIRLVGGEIPVEKLKFINGLIPESGAKFAHITTRQDIQLHDVSPLSSIEVIRSCSANGLPFRGGGGDTFRNIAITAMSGIADDGSFDLAPCARFLTEAVFDWDIAFRLPRKIKIGFATREDAPLALRQDLGFVAATDDAGRRGFVLYGGGGFGRESTTGVKLFDFLPAEKIVPAARAMVELFSDHGDSCMMNSSGEFLTPLLDIGRYDNTFRLHVELWQYAAYSADMDIYAVNGEGVTTHLKTLGVNNTRSSLVFDSVFILADSTVRLSFVADAMLKVDNIRLSNSMAEQQEQGTVTTTADSCIFSSLTPNTVYHCFVQGQEDTLSFATRDVIRVDSVCDVSPYGASVHLTLNMRECPHSYVLKRLSDQTTAYANDLFFSQFVTSDTYHRAIEIYNGTGEDVPLEDYRLAVDIYAGTGNYSSSSTLTFTDRDTIRHNECIVIMQTLNDMSGQSEGVYYINPDLNASRPIDGNDPFALIRGNDTVDIFGSFSAAVTNNYGWQDGDMRTAKVCIKRKSSVTKGVINSSSEGFPTLAMEWEQVGNVADTDAEVFADIGTHHMQDALSGECMDSVIVGFETTEERIGIEGLEQYTTYELYVLVQNGEETYRSNTVRFRTGKVTQRTEDGVWHDGNWSRGIPEEKDEVILYNPLTLRIEEGTVARCCRLTVRDTLSEARAQLINDGQLVCRQGVYVERALGLAEGQEGSSVLLGFPISVVDSSMEALAACVTQTEGNVLHADMQVQSPLQTQAYRLDYTLAQTLCFKGLLNNDDVYDMSDNAREQLGDMEVMYAFNPYPFTVQVNQLLRQGVSLPQRLDGRLHPPGHESGAGRSVQTAIEPFAAAGGGGCAHFAF